MAWSRVHWPLPRRDPDEPSQPVELLLDITFVLALQQAGSFLGESPGLAGVLRALAALTVVACLWQTSVVAVTIVSVSIAPIKLIDLAQTALFLMLTVTLAEAFSDHPHGIGQIVFRATLSLSIVTSMLQWIFAVRGYPAYYRNAIIINFAYLAYGAAVWWSLHLHGATQSSG
jgi:low temperature requirement protein LtrA